MEKDLAFWQEHMAAIERAGISISAYAKRHDIHHASLCIAAYGFLMRERLSGAKKNGDQLKEPALPEDFRPRGARSDATAYAGLNRHIALSLGTRHLPRLVSVPMLRACTR